MRLVSWLVRGQCLWHDEPIFDRDETGAIFRCPRCLHSWPRLHDATEPPRQVMPAAVRVAAHAPSQGSRNIAPVSPISAGA